jgi:sugar lactone lactonase YvrE
MPDIDVPRRTAPMAESTDLRAEVVLDGLSFPEGPRWQDGRLFFSDFYGHRVLAYAPTGDVETVCEVPGQPSGLGFTPAGELLVVSMTDRRLLRLAGGVLHEVASLGALAPGVANDMVVDEDGRAYIGNFGSDLDGGDDIRPTTLARVDPDGSVHIAADGLVFPNGAAITPDGRTFLVAETFAFRITAFDRARDGMLSNRRVWANFGPGPATVLADVLAARPLAPDGICLDAEGAIWAASATTPGIVRVREGGEVVERVDTGELSVFAAALGGEDGRTLYLCAGPPLGAIDPSAERCGALMACRVAVPAAGR